MGKSGDDLRRDTGAQGETVGLAARTEGLAEPGAIRLMVATPKLQGA